MAELVAELAASPVRRYFGVATMTGLGVLLLWLALTQNFDQMGWKLALIAMAVAALWAAMRMLQATALRLELREDGLYDSEDHLLAAYDDIVTVERGMLAMKPSNGFMIVTRSKKPRRWRPGLYWVMGRRIGVGGVTAAADAKYLADLMNMQLVERRGGL
ncbi:hypothetical protein [Marinovum sp.]|uniref:hypothetical protein n=1 Tax=Marinovum sp. TaxID=2024839 RepID=UPI002B278F10|nr:hypothetical protein [Marinovum sp.]